MSTRMTEEVVGELKAKKLSAENRRELLVELTGGYGWKFRKRMLKTLRDNKKAARSKKLKWNQIQGRKGSVLRELYALKKKAAGKFVTFTPAELEWTLRNWGAIATFRRYGNSKHLADAGIVGIDRPYVIGTPRNDLVREIKISKRQIESWSKTSKLHFNPTPPKPKRHYHRRKKKMTPRKVLKTFITRMTAMVMNPYFEDRYPEEESR